MKWGRCISSGQNCKINDSIHSVYQYQWTAKTNWSLSNCYKIIKTDPNNTLFKGMTDLNNRDFDPLETFSNDLNNFRASITSSNSIRGGYEVMGIRPQNKWTCSTPPPSQERGPRGIWYQRDWNKLSGRYWPCYRPRWGDYPGYRNP